MSDKETFKRNHPEAFFLEKDSPDHLESYLHNQNWIPESHSIKNIESAGDGNMNLTLRVITEAGSIIVKQSRPWVEKYDFIAAPWDRCLVEAKYYETISDFENISRKMPKLIGIDSKSRIMALEDLGQAQDCSSIYDGETLSLVELGELTQYLADLHTVQPPNDPLFANKEMRELNHQHIFIIPFKENDVPLEDFTRGLSAARNEIINNFPIAKKAQELGEIYLSEGSTLLHGDFYPGSWLKTPWGLRVIDPEFCFLGPKEFDVGVFLGHLLLASQPKSSWDSVLQNYISKVQTLDSGLVKKFAGVEVLRRILGVAQLPLQLDLPAKTQLLNVATQMLLDSDSL